MNKDAISLATNIGNMVSVSRRARKIKQADLAVMAGIGMNTMVAIEKGVTTVQLGFYLQVMTALGINNYLQPLSEHTSDKVGVESMTKLLPKRVIGKRTSRRSAFSQEY